MSFREVILSRIVQLHVLLEKNFILCRRKWKTSLLRLLHPLIFVFILWIIQKVQVAKHPVLHPTAHEIGKIPKCEGNSCFSLLYSPVNDSNVHAIMQIIADKHGFSIPTFEEALIYDLSSNYPNLKFYDVAPVRDAYDFAKANQNTTQACVVFDNSYPPSGFMPEYLVSPGHLPYVIFYNDTSSSNVFTGKSKTYNLEMQVQRATDEALIQHFTGIPTELNIFHKPYPTVVFPDSNENPEPVTMYAAIPLLSCTHMISILICLQEINWERDKKLRQGLVMMGMKELPYWCHWFLTQTLFVAISSAFILGVGYATGMSFFRNSNLAVIYLLFLVYGMASFPVAFILSTFAKTPVKANAFCVAIFVLSIVVAALFITFPFGNFGFAMLSLPFIDFLASLIPAVNFGNIAADITIRSRYVLVNDTWMEGPGFHWSDLHNNTLHNATTPEFHRTTSSSFGYMFVSMAIWSVLAWYIDNVRPGEHGSRKKPYFFALPSYWGLGARAAPNVAIYKHNVKKISSVLPDMDKDIEREHQYAMELAKNDSNGIIILKLSKTYEGGARALDTLTVGCEAGNVLCLLGHNGAGKTTAISVMTGLYEASSGDALLFGYSTVYEMDKIRKIMGVCPQHDILWDQLTAREHLHLFSKLKGVAYPENEIQTRLQEVRLDKVAMHFSSTFSGGMKRRLSVAIASIGDPKIIFMDEPTSGLDPRSRIQLAQLVQTLKKDKIIVLTTHSMEEADALGDKIAILALGRLRAVGDSLHLKTRYGVGYHISLVCDAENSEELINLVKREFPVAKLRFQSAGNLVYTLPYINHDQVTAFFAWIEKGVPYINDWGVSHTTLEEVFLRITHGDETEKTDNTELSVYIEGIDESIGTININGGTSLAEARSMVNRLPHAVPYFMFLHSQGPIPPHQEHLHLTSKFAPALTIRPESESDALFVEANWENEKTKLLQVNESKVAEMEQRLESLKAAHNMQLNDMENKHAQQMQTIQQENALLKHRLTELEQLLNLKSTS